MTADDAARHAALDAQVAALAPAVGRPEAPPATVWFDRDAVRLELACDETAAGLDDGAWCYLPDEHVAAHRLRRWRRQVLHAHCSSSGRWVLVTWLDRRADGTAVVVDQLFRPDDVLAVEYDEVTEHHAGAHALVAVDDCALCAAETGGPL